MQIQDATNKKQ